MVNKTINRKGAFWILTVFFGILLLTGLGFLWVQPTNPSHHTTMMGSTMGLMMKNELGAIGLADLFQSEKQSVEQMSGHHQGTSLLAKIHFTCTAIIVCLMPFIVGGTIFLVVLWM